MSLFSNCPYIYIVHELSNCCLNTFGSTNLWQVNGKWTKVSYNVIVKPVTFHFCMWFCRVVNYWMCRIKRCCVFIHSIKASTVCHIKLTFNALLIFSPHAKPHLIGQYIMFTIFLARSNSSLSFISQHEITKHQSIKGKSISWNIST